MGGNGSGGHNRRTRGYVEECLRLDARVLRRATGLEDGWNGRINWSRTTCCAARIADGQLEMMWDREGRNSVAMISVALDWVDMPVGGRQPYFICPCCSRRMLILIIAAGGRMGCRTCLGVVHRSTCEGSSDRALRQAFKLRGRLEADVSLLSPVFIKPARMRWRTFWLRRLKLVRAEERFWGSAAKELGIAIE